MSEARRLLEALAKATQPMDFCHVCLCAHSNFKDASDHKEWCAWAKADAFLADPPACDAEKAVLVAALGDARMLCMNDHAYDNETSQVFEAVQVINRALADIPSAAAALLAKVEAQDADLTEIATTMTEHFDSVDLNDLPVSLTKGILALLAQGERQRKALGHALHLVEHNKANCARCREAHKRIRAALAPGEEKE
ncbi:hypothetical protein LCGC14_2109140 [marine sediment metagenome]|uniref:Uncharacterized protein n=1 Tax=marine sediment metagenome TaxID=412755 RepID=A0A0F9H3Y3_9ZZZZ